MGTFNRNEYMREYRNKNKDSIKQLKADIKSDDYDLIDGYCKKNDISKAKFIVEACKHYIDNHGNK
ncbi:MAG: hypothetical protein OSJ54_02360 [Oscillospiraceae bacterium]|nr:hypothetical protein [Oscillospiraceae bacterium]MCX4255753.1 hypothetical protein [Oscillospiraceae bacterium]